MKWFKHDTDASNDAKIKKLIIKHGAEGYAVYFHCLELIAGGVCSENITFELEHDSEIIADNLKIKSEPGESSIDKVNRIMKTIIDQGLFEDSENKITCLKLAKRLDQSMTSNPEMRKIIEKIKNHDSVMTVPDKVMQDKTRLDKNRLDKSINIYIPVLLHWNSKNIIIHKEEVFKKNLMKKHKGIIDIHSEEVIKKAIDNYSTVLFSNKYYWSHRWTLFDFLARGIEKFLDSAKPLENFLNKGNVPEVTKESSENKYAGFRR